MNASNSPFFFPANHWLISVPFDGQPYIAADGSVLGVRHFFLRQRFRFSGRQIRLVILEMPGGAADDLLGHHGHPPPRHPAIGAGDILAVRLDDRSELRVEAGAGFVAFA